MGGKKVPMNRHAAAAAERKGAAADAAAAKQQQAEDDAHWADGDKKGKKKAEKAAGKADKQREKQAAKEVTKALEREEEAREAEKRPKKVTQAMINKEMTKMRGGYGGGPAKTDAKMVTEEDQEKMLEKGGKNRAEAKDVDATGLKDATEQLAQLNLKQDAKEDEHPERRMKAAHLAFEEKNIPRLKAENPGLKHSQIKEMCWKEWQKSPENPMVQQMMKQMAARQKQ